MNILALSYLFYLAATLPPYFKNLLTLKRVIRLIHVQILTIPGVLETRGNRQNGHELQTESSKNGNATFDAIVESGVDVSFKHTRFIKRIGDSFPGKVICSTKKHIGPPNRAQGLEYSG